MNERHELAAIISRPEEVDHGPLSCGPNSTYAGRVADAILAAGYRKPRTITTIEELDGLPDGSAIMLFDHGVFLRVNVPSFDWIDGDGNMSYSSTLDRFLPATVLHEPETTK